MKRILIVVVLAIVIAGCTSGDGSRTESSEFQTKCLDGVIYYVTTETIPYKGYGFMSVKYNRDGTVETC